MPDQLKPVPTRQMEVYAGFLEYTDHHIGRRPPARVEMHLLVGGGWLGVSTFGAADPARARIQEVWEPFLPPALQPSRRRDQGPFGSDEGVEQLLRRAGLTDVRTVHRRFEVVYQDADQLIEVSWSTAQRALWEAIPQPDHPAVGERIRAVFAELAGGPGPLRTQEDVRYTLGCRP